MVSINRKSSVNVVCQGNRLKNITETTLRIECELYNLSLCNFQPALVYFGADVTKTQRYARALYRSFT